MTTVDLGYVPRPWQRAVHLARKRWSVLVVHRRGGKTVLAVMELLDQAMRLAKPSGRYAYIAPYQRQAKDIAWAYLKHYALKVPGTTVNETELWVRLRNGAVIRIYGADNPDSLRGIYLDGLVLDEVAQMSPTIWQDVLRPALSDREGWALFIGTPNGVNLFSDIYFKALDKPEWYRGLYTVRDTGALPDDEVAKIEAELQPPVFAREYLCDFSVAASNQLLSMSDVDTAMRRVVRPGSYEHMPLVFGLDVAREGDDDTCLIKRRGCYVRDPIILSGADASQVADRVALEISEDHPDAVFIDISGGYGGGVMDRLRLLQHRCVGVQFGGAASSARFLNKRAEMWWDMALAIKESTCLPNLLRLRKDLTGPTYRHNAKDQLVLESKDDMRARGLPSPDVGDALALTWAHPVRPPDLAAADERFREATGNQQRQQYDPMARARRRLGV